MARTLWIVLFGVFFLGCGESRKEVEEKPPFFGGAVVDEKGFGTIAGEVKVSGATPLPTGLAITKDKEVCGNKVRTSEELVVNKDGGVKWVVVYLERVKSDKKYSAPVVLDQKGCRFSPHVLIVGAGEKLEIRNPDGILHNFHAYTKINSPVNIAQPKFKKSVTVKFEKPEIFKIGCDVHGWMSGWIVVAEHPFYAVTDGEGKFKFANVPAGKYKIKLWHETLGEIVSEAVVRQGQTLNIGFASEKLIAR